MVNTLRVVLDVRLSKKLLLFYPIIFCGILEKNNSLWTNHLHGNYVQDKYPLNYTFKASDSSIWKRL